MSPEIDLPEGDYCFSLPTGNGSPSTLFKQEQKMKSRNVTSIQHHGNARPEKPSRSSKAKALPGEAPCPHERAIAEAAYFRAEQRGFAPGNEMGDWLEAEAEIARSL